jgi:hypothetical protein
VSPASSALLCRAGEIVALCIDGGSAVDAVAATAAAAAVVVVIALVAREMGGTSRAQAFTAWAMLGAPVVLVLAHAAWTTSLGIVVLPIALACALRATLRDDGRWWVVGGAAAGLGGVLWPLSVVPVAAVAAGLAAFGPRRWFSSAWFRIGAVLAVLPAAIAWSWRLAAGSAASPPADATGGWAVLALLVMLPGPALAVLAVCGTAGMLRIRAWRHTRFVVVAVVAAVVAVLVAGHDAVPAAAVVGVLSAAGATRIDRWASTRRRRAVVTASLALAIVVAALLALLPLSDR